MIRVAGEELSKVDTNAGPVHTNIPRNKYHTFLSGKVVYHSNEGAVAGGLRYISVRQDVMKPLCRFRLTKAGRCISGM